MKEKQKTKGMSMPQMRYLSVKDMANVLMSENTGLDVKKIFLQILEGREVDRRDDLHIIIADNYVKKLYDEIRYAKENSDSVLGKHFLRDLYRLLKYMSGDKKFEDILNEIEDKKVLKSVKKAHMVNADPKESGPWIITDECDDAKTFFSIYHKLLDKVDPQILVQYWSTPNKDNQPYIPIIEKINKFKHDEENQWNDEKFGTKISTKDDKEGIRTSLEYEVQSLRYPDNYEMIMRQMANEALKPKETEPTIEDLQKKIQELEKQLAKETNARKSAEMNLANLKTSVLAIGRFGGGVAYAKDMAKDM